MGPKCKPRERKKERRGGARAAPGLVLGTMLGRGSAGLDWLGRGWPFFFTLFIFLKAETFITFAKLIQMDSKKFVKFCKNNIYQNIPFGNN